MKFYKKAMEVNINFKQFFIERNLFSIDDQMFFIQKKLTHDIWTRDETSIDRYSPPLRFKRNSNGASIMLSVRNDYPKRLVDDGKYPKDNFYVYD